jgi:hypothetical protein
MLFVFRGSDVKHTLLGKEKLGSEIFISVVVKYG